jgi:MFS transporter, DHA2 family, methylenomycin A resistance protein
MASKVRSSRPTTRAIGMWAMGGAAASSAGPVTGGLLTLASWRLIFFINVPAEAAALFLLARTLPSPCRWAPFDWAGQATSRQAGGALAIAVFGALLASRAGFLAGLRTSLLIAAAVALTAAAGSILLRQPATRAKGNRDE